MTAVARVDVDYSGSACVSSCSRPSLIIVVNVSSGGWYRMCAPCWHRLERHARLHQQIDMSLSARRLVSLN